MPFSFYKYFAKLLLTALIMLPVCAAAETGEPVTAFAPAPKSEGSIPFAFAISGGISLGSYEAGMNWAFLKYQKALREQASKGTFLPPNLMGVTGASAGGINALMTGISWCVDPKKTQQGEYDDEISKNLFRDVWLGVGFDRLIPQKENEYFEDDGLLSRRAFDDVLKKLERMLASNIFIPRCSVPIGLMVTRTKPLEMSVDGLKVENERFIIPLLLSVDSTGKATFSSNVVNSDVAGLGNTIYLAGSGAHDEKRLPVIETKAVIDAVLASSAFPVAFGRRELKYCIKSGSGNPCASGPREPGCPDGYRIDSADFVDGGVFDNIPLGAAKALAEPHEFDIRTREEWQKAGRRFNYIYIDPDHRRGDRRHAEERVPGKTGKSVAKTYGLKSQLGFLSGAITTGRNYELYKAMQSGEWTRQAPLYALKVVIPAIDCAIHRQNGSIVGAGAQLPTPRECDGLYDDLQKDPGRPDLDHLKLARLCLRGEAQNLERTYLPFVQPSAEQPSNDDVARMRSALTDHMQLLTNRLGERQDELYVKMLAKDKLGDRRILLSTRFFPITGNYLSYFGAFMDLPLRQFDYYAGVYDAANDIVGHSCEFPSLGADLAEYIAKKHTCEVTQAREVYEKLGVHQDAGADTIFHFLAEKEHRGSWGWLSEYPPASTDNNLLAVGKSLEKTEQNARNDKEGATEQSEFEIFIRELVQNKYSYNSEEMKYILKLYQKDESLWYYPLASRASERLLALEHREAKATGKSGPKTGLSVAALALNTYVHDEKRFTLSPSSAPDWAWQNILPYEIFIDARNGGGAGSWEPRLRLTDDLYLSLKATPVGYNKYGQDWILFTQGDLYLTYNQTNNLYSAGLGPTINYAWDEWPGHKQVNYGGSIFGGLFNKFRLTIGVRSFEKGGFSGDNWYIQMGITDIPGFAYWLSR